jgi:hypothetical protein
LKRNGEKNGNETAFFFPLFIPSSLLVFLLVRRGKGERKRIREIAFWRINEKCKNIVVSEK